MQLVGNMKSKHTTYYNTAILWLFLILAFAFLIRTFHLTLIPFGFFADEASIGYNAYTLASSGIDEHGKKYPIFFEAFGEFKNPIQIWSTALSILFLGLNDFSIRIVSVFYGVCSILAIYLLTKEIFIRLQYKKVLGVFAALLLCITPWHIHFSRVALEGLMPYILFTTLGAYFFLKAQRTPLYFFISVASFALSLYCYFPARIFIPTFGLFISLIYYKFFLTHKMYAICGFLLLILMMAPILSHSLSPDGLARWKRVSIFYENTTNTQVIGHILKNYTLHFSPDFLFIKGDSGMTGNSITRHSVLGFGELYFLQFPLILFGIFYLFRYDKRLCLMIMIWIFLYPLGSAFTTDQNPQATRSIIGIIPLTILTISGGWYIINKIDLKKRRKALITTTFITFLFLVLFCVYLITYAKIYPTYSSGFWGWQYGPRDIIPYFLKNKENYDQLILVGNFNESYVFIKFYDPTNLCQNKCMIGGINQYNSRKKQLFAIGADRLEELNGLKLENKKILYYPNKQPAFYLSEIKKN